eukprot:941247-Amphidinium_carterae.3
MPRCNPREKFDYTQVRQQAAKQEIRQDARKSAFWWCHLHMQSCCWTVANGVAVLHWFCDIWSETLSVP